MNDTKIIFPPGTTIHCGMCNDHAATLNVQRLTGELLRCEDFTRPDGTPARVNERILQCSCEGAQIRAVLP